RPAHTRSPLPVYLSSSMIPTPPLPTLFPYTTLFRSKPIQATHWLALSYPISLSIEGEVGFAKGCVYSCGPRFAMNGNFGRISTRSEEHTSELQSRFDLVCRLLLEKKKKSDS